MDISPVLETVNEVGSNVAATMTNSIETTVASAENISSAITVENSVISATGPDVADVLTAQVVSAGKEGLGTDYVFDEILPNIDLEAESVEEAFHGVEELSENVIPFPNKMTEGMSSENVSELIDMEQNEPIDLAKYREEKASEALDTSQITEDANTESFAASLKDMTEDELLRMKEELEKELKRIPKEKNKIRSLLMFLLSLIVGELYNSLKEDRMAIAA